MDLESKTQIISRVGVLIPKKETKFGSKDVSSYFRHHLYAALFFQPNHLTSLSLGSLSVERSRYEVT